MVGPTNNKTLKPSSQIFQAYVTLRKFNQHANKMPAAQSGTCQLTGWMLGRNAFARAVRITDAVLSNVCARPCTVDADNAV